MNGSAARKAAYEKGVLAEQACALYLRALGYQVLEMRYKAPVGEIDLLVRRDRVLAAVEVKARRSVSEALEAITPRNQRRVEQALLHYLAAHPEYMDFDLRFDVMAYQGILRIEHLDNAWRPEA